MHRCLHALVWATQMRMQRALPMAAQTTTLHVLTSEEAAQKQSQDGACAHPSWPANRLPEELAPRGSDSLALCPLTRRSVRSQAHTHKKEAQQWRAPGAWL